MIKQCAQCGEKFGTDQHKRKFCGKECWRISRTGKARPEIWKRVTKQCVVCGTEFETGGQLGKADRQYCSWPCRYKARFRRGKEANELSVIDAAYIAGFVDGEGSIMINRSHKDSIIIKMSITNTNRAVLDWMADVTGVGSVIVQYRMTEKRKPTWMFNIFTTGAETILRQILPYMKIKKAQAELALETQDKLKIPAQKADRTWQFEAVAQMQKMNKRGSA